MKRVFCDNFEKFLVDELGLKKNKYDEFLKEYRVTLGEKYSSANNFELKDNILRKIYRKLWEVMGIKKLARGAISVQPDVGIFLYIFTQLTKPKVVVETGTFAGYSAVHFSAAMKKNGFGKVITTDINPNAGWGIPKKLLNDNIEFHASQEPLSLLSTITPKNFDLFFHDSDHSYENVKNELKIVLPKIASKGILISHDSCRRTQSGPFKAFSELDDWHVFFIDSDNDQGTVLAVKDFDYLKKGILANN
ncbi:MAG: class I SAM-dependent methyltransferase [archaeon]|nr:class I SAM-dependent methyltransferase [archaeon]